MKFKAVIAAAGLSSRMHEFKPMMRLGSSTIINNVIQNFKDAGVEEILVVVGYKAKSLQSYLLSQNVKVCENRNFADTKMLDSIKIGLTQVGKDGEYDYIFVTPGDVPLVRAETIEKMKASADLKRNIIRPSLCEKAGHPVLISRDFAEKLSGYNGQDGLRGFLKAHFHETYFMEVDDPGIITDADTKEDYKILRRMDMENKSRGKLWYEMDIKVAKADTILTAEMAQFLEMIDYTGSIQSACACMHMSYSKGWTALKKMEGDLGYLLTICTAGGEGGGGSRLSAKGRALLGAYQRFTQHLTQVATEIFDEIFTEDIHGET